MVLIGLNLVDVEIVDRVSRHVIGRVTDKTLELEETDRRQALRHSLAIATLADVFGPSNPIMAEDRGIEKACLEAMSKYIGVIRSRPDILPENIGLIRMRECNFSRRLIGYPAIRYLMEEAMCNPPAKSDQIHA
jgi:hypothetical protein